MRKPKLEELANGHFRVRFSVKGNRLIESFGSDRDEAERRYATWWATFSQAMLDRKIDSVVSRTDFDVAAGLPSVSIDHLTLSDLADRYCSWAVEEFSHTARPGHHQKWLTSFAIDFFGDIYWSELTVAEYKRFRNHMIGQGKNRTRINQILADFRRWLRWCHAENKLIPVRLDLEFGSVASLKPLRKGVTEKIDTIPVFWDDRGADHPYPQATQLLPFLAPNVRAMVTCQFWAGMRPSEACTMRPMDLLENIDGIMYYLPSSHKNSWRSSKSVKLIKVLNWRCREAIGELVDACETEDEYLFKPWEAYEWVIHHINNRNGFCKTGDKPSTTPGQMRRRRKGAESRRERLQSRCDERFSELTYRTHLDSGFKRAARAGVSLNRWTPNQLRHGAMTMMADHGFTQAGSHLLGHQKLKTSLTHYDHESLKRLAGVVGKLDKIDPKPNAS